MTLTQINYIIIISETGSINKAAEALYVSQPSLTESVKDIENELGFKIFNRTSRGVTLTTDGAEFLPYCRQVAAQYEMLEEKFIKGDNFRRKFCVSCQHYSFAVKAFVETVNSFDTLNYEFAIRETRTSEIINDVATLRSEIGILYLSGFNRKALTKLFKQNELNFYPIIDCRAFAYLWKGHPLADKEYITYDELKQYPCLSFEQGDNSSFYLAEEILSEKPFPRTVKVCDRATMLNLMIGLNGFTVCSGIICEELNGGDYVAVPLDRSDPDLADIMQIGYIMRKNAEPTDICSAYIAELKKYFN